MALSIALKNWNNLFYASRAGGDCEFSPRLTALEIKPRGRMESNSSVWEFRDSQENYSTFVLIPIRRRHTDTSTLVSRGLTADGLLQEIAIKEKGYFS